VPTVAASAWARREERAFAHPTGDSSRSKYALETLMHPKIVRTTLREEPNMRLIAFVAAVAAAFISSGPLAAQEWQEYAYPDYAFTVAFPAKPRVETTTYPLADGCTVPAHVYSVGENNGVLAVTVAQIGDTGLDENAVIEGAIKRLSAGGEVKVNMPHRIYRVCGR
jgi:hypothetical protein